MSWADEQPLRTALVVYESRFGKTRRIAEALARGFRAEGVRTDVVPVSEASHRALENYDLLAVGAPATHLGVPTETNAFLHTLGTHPHLHHHYGFAFETRQSHHPGGAGRHIESVLRDSGLQVTVPHAYAVVEGPGSASGSSPAPDSQEFRLEASAEAAFEEFGARLVRTIRGEEQNRAPVT